jgi:hypothetical protein
MTEFCGVWNGIGILSVVPAIREKHFHFDENGYGSHVTEKALPQAHARRAERLRSPAGLRGTCPEAVAGR